MMCSTTACKLYRHPLIRQGLAGRRCFRSARFHTPASSGLRSFALLDDATTTDAPEDPDTAPAKPSRMEAWRAHSFGPASEQPYRRRTSDWYRLVIGIGILVFAIWHEDSPTQFEKNLFTTLNGLPNQLDSLFHLVYALGALWALLASWWWRRS